MTKVEDNKAVELLEKAAETCFQTMKEGLKMQEDFADRWIKAVKEAKGSEDWGKQMEAAAAKITEQAKQNAEEAAKLMEEGAKDGMAMFNKAVEMGGIATPGEAQVKMQQLWQEGMSVMNKNAKAVVQANAQMLQGWGEMAKENVEKAAAKAS